MMRFFSAAAAVCLTGCANMNYVMDGYGSVELKEVATRYDTFRVFDRPQDGRLMVTASLGAAAGQGFVGGLLLNPGAAASPKPIYQEAAETFLTQSGRRGCTITDGYVLIEPQWEFKYQCPAAIAAR